MMATLRIVSLFTSLAAAASLASGASDEWTSWSECSRTCDGGAAYSRRRCTSGRCDNIRYRVCNTDPCPGGRDFRAQQCAAYNQVPFRGRHLAWRAYEDPRYPCSLVCAAVGTRFAVQMAPKVLDGTSCAGGMCINGHCRRVGCDNILDSHKRLDVCGVCGGDGSSCAANNEVSGEKAVYTWREAWGECSVSCGVGSQDALVTCYDRRTGQAVEDAMCSVLSHPQPRRQECAQPTCPAVWITGDWSTCSASCGGGESTRPVYCVEQRRANGTFQRRANHDCPEERRPEQRRPCNDEPCPKWFAGEWSPCSVTCGSGYQLRAVVCRRTKYHDCAPASKPHVARRCLTHVSCMGETVSENDVVSSAAPEAGAGDVGSGQEDEELRAPNTPPKRPVLVVATGPPPTVRDLTQYRSYHREGAGDQGYEDEDGDGRLHSAAHSNNPDFTDYDSFLEKVGSSLSERDRDEFWDKDDHDYRGWEVAEAEEGADGQTQEVSMEPSFMASPWGKCSASCGDGRRYRIVECKVFLEFSQTVETVDDTQCTGPKPDEVSLCHDVDCPGEEQQEDVVAPAAADNFSWRFVGYGACSAACGAEGKLGDDDASLPPRPRVQGVEKPQFMCLRMADYSEVDETFCARFPPPPVSHRVCNGVPCRPVWRTYSFGACSASCGGGERRRRVECVQESAEPGVRGETRPPAMCPGQPPAESMPCNVIDCPPEWHTEEWSECSSTCGSGLQVRSVQCRQRVGDGRQLDMPDLTCEHLSRPLSQKPCVLLACPITLPATGGEILIDPSSYIQLGQRKRLFLTVGGAASVLPKTRLSVRCTVSKFNRKRVRWTDQHGAEIPRKGRVKMSRNGVLHIRRVHRGDEGAYTCHAGKIAANFTISIHDKDEALSMTLARREYILQNYKFISKFQDSIKHNSAKSKAEYTLPYIFEHFDKADIPFQWMAGPWDRCSRTCGGDGLQSRDITCEVMMEEYLLVADPKFCAELRPYERPLETRDCGFHQCPEWQVGDWSQCTDELCLGPGLGGMKRPLYCVSPHNGSVLDLDACHPDHQPLHRQQCPMATCQPTWKTSKWTECSVSCGGEGIRTRSLECVWVPNKQPAGRDCRLLKRPAVMKPCTAPACTDVDKACRDDSKYCSLVPKMNLCRLNKYRRECCLSCMTHSLIHGLFLQ